jgi:ribosomal protein L32
MEKCSKCGSKKMIETITKGITQEVLWDEDDYILEEKTYYNRTMKHSTYKCANCGNPL